MCKPLHQHDCRSCRFLGSFDGKDVYQCDHIDLCIRWGDSDEENKSLPISIVLHERFKGTDWNKALGLYEQSLLSYRLNRA
jgi:hypothetical protein